MNWRTLVVFILVTFMLTFVFLSARSTHTIRPAKNQVTGAQRKGTAPKPPGKTKESEEKRRNSLVQNPNVYPAANADLGSSAKRERETERNQIKPVRPDLRVVSAMQQVFADSDPGAKTKFQGGLELLDRGDFNNARRLFQEILADYGLDCRQNKLAGSAYWAMGLSYYRQGGEDGLAISVTFFENFIQTYPNCEPQELVQDAQLNIAVAYIDRMRLAEKETARERAAQGAVTALKTFLGKFPDSPHSFPASVALVNLQNYLSRPRY